MTLPSSGDTDWGTTLNAHVNVEHESDGTHKVNTKYAPIDSTGTQILTKYFTGTTDADSGTSVSHGITGIDNILMVSAAVFSSSSNRYCVSSYRTGADVTEKFRIQWDGTSVILGDIGTDCQSQKYRIKIEYIV